MSTLPKEEPVEYDEDDFGAEFNFAPSRWVLGVTAFIMVVAGGLVGWGVWNLVARAVALVHRIF